MSEERPKKIVPSRLIISGLIGAAAGITAYLFYESLDDDVKNAIRMKLKRSTVQFLKQVLSLDDVEVSALESPRAKELPASTADAS